MLHERILYALRGLLYRLQPWLQGWDKDAWPVVRKRHRRTQFYFGPPQQSRKKRLLTIGLGIVLIAVFIFSAAKLVSYGVDYAEAKQASEALRAAYYQQATAQPTVLPTAAPTSTAIPASTTSAPVKTAAPALRLETVKYPGNPYTIVSSRFAKIRRQNEDIIGWLTIEDVVDEAVVQRDNEYYLKRDYRGYHNVNGAIFLDENCDLKTRPYTLLLYGHNMKTGLMFGGLRNYENITFYRNNPFITFDTMYEDGRYVVFAVMTISTDPANWRYANLSWLVSSSVTYRSKAISELARFSIYKSQIDVLPEDQILLLITCVDDEEDRRVVAARRIREGESEEELLRLVKKTRSR